MAITKRDPNTIHLAGPMIEVEEYVASAAITPGMLVELHDDSGTIKVRPNASATEFQAKTVALEHIALNKTVDDAYAIGDLVKVGYMGCGSVFWGLIPSGQNISGAELLKSNADGKLQSAGTTTAAANLGIMQSLSAPGAVTADTRLRVQFIV